MVGDVRDLLPTLAAGSVRCCVTSPPYFGLRDYGTAKWEGGDAGCDHKQSVARHDGGRTNVDGFNGSAKANSDKGAMNFRDVCGKCGAVRIDSQIGLEPTPEAYVAELVAVFREVRRVLTDDGTLFLNLGDSYFGTSQTGGIKGKEGSAKRAGRMFSRPAGSRRATAYGTGDKEPEGSPARDCFCQSLCGACRAAYRIGKSHSGRPPAPMLGPSPSAPTLGSMESAPDHSPTSDSSRPTGRSEAATLDSSQTAARVVGQRPGVRGSTTGESSLPLGDSRSPVSTPDAGCLLCGCSLPDLTPASADTTDCICGTGSRSGASDQSKTGTLSGDLAYPNIANTSLKSKDLLGIPWRVAFALQADGWYLRSDIIWAKPNPMPESVTDRPTKAHEYIFLLSKSPTYYYDADAIAEDAIHAGAVVTNDAGKNGQMGKYGQTRTGFLRDGGVTVAATRNARTVWTIATQPYAGAHFATFPVELARRCILAGSAKGDVVLDPFGGSGTVAAVATGHGREAILCELNPAYAELARERIGAFLLAPDQPAAVLPAQAVPLTLAL